MRLEITCNAEQSILRIEGRDITFDRHETGVTSKTRDIENSVGREVVSGLTKVIINLMKIAEIFEGQNVWRLTDREDCDTAREIMHFPQK